MPKKIDCIGKRFGRLIVLKNLPPKRFSSGTSYRVVLCRCDCGTEKEIRLKSIKNNDTKSCGCLNREKLKARSTHKMIESSEYSSWSSIIQRCTNKKSKHFKNWGARGITVCEEWKKFENFFADMGKKPFEGAQIDRIDNEKGYYKENCRWVTSRENLRNTRRNRIIKYKGQSKCLVEWAELLKINYQTLRSRIGRLGWSVERAFTS